jgi:hypothetical protein
MRATSGRACVAGLCARTIPQTRQRSACRPGPCRRESATASRRIAATPETASARSGAGEATAGAHPAPTHPASCRDSRQTAARKTVLITGSARRGGGSCPRRADQAKALCGGSYLHKDATRFLLPLSLAARRVLLGRLPGPAHPGLDLVGPRGKLQALRRHINITATRRARSAAHPRAHAPHNTTDDTFPDDPTEAPSKSSRALTSSWIAARRACAWVRPTRPRCAAYPGHTSA